MEARHTAWNVLLSDEQVAEIEIALAEAETGRFATIAEVEKTFRELRSFGASS